ncbi:MAG TPA: hypothetical protein PKO06_15050 [Candidatus Ozemobacteraceae bacterium]|nr:hypothetical protein [Candidatus Ozemobacteraceae bacterium]
MKTFTHTWEGEIFLLHLELNRSDAVSYQADLVRAFRDGKTSSEVIRVKEQETSYRFLVTRTHPRETSFTFQYPDDVNLKAFKLDDRAYYPTESFFEG